MAFRLAVCGMMVATVSLEFLKGMDLYVMWLVIQGYVFFILVCLGFVV